jgi:hypothetical protein
MAGWVAARARRPYLAATSDPAPQIDAYAPAEVAARARAIGVHDQAAVLGTITNIVVVTGGNIVGGTLLVAGVYWTIYLRPPAAR